MTPAARMNDCPMNPIYYLFTLFLIGVGLSQATVLPHLQLFGQQIDPMLACVIAWSVLRGVREGLIWALVGGLVLDLLSAAPFGVFTLALAGASLSASVGAASFFRSHALLPLIAFVVGSLSYYVISLSLLFFSGRDFPFLDAISRIVLPGMVLNLAVMLVAYPVIRWLHRSTAPREMGW